LITLGIELFLSGAGIRSRGSQRLKLLIGLSLGKRECGRSGAGSQVRGGNADMLREQIAGGHRLAGLL
jgi:hypothetical protein